MTAFEVAHGAVLFSDGMSLADALFFAHAGCGVLLWYTKDFALADGSGLGALVCRDTLTALFPSFSMLPS